LGERKGEDAKVDEGLKVDVKEVKEILKIKQNLL
jgi:hypothetical protein